MPTSELFIGTVGVLEDGYFFRAMTTLQDLGIEFSPEKDIVVDKSPTPLSFESSQSVEFISKLAGEVNSKLPNIPAGKAGIGLEFSAAGAFIIKAAEVYESRIRNLVPIENAILEAYKKDVWKKNYAVIYSLLQAPYVDIIISRSSQSKIELEADASGGSVGKIELGNANLGFSIKNESGSVFSALGAKDVSPAFQLLGIKKNWLGKPDVGVLESVTGVDDGQNKQTPGDWFPELFKSIREAGGAVKIDGRNLFKSGTKSDAETGFNQIEQVSKKFRKEIKATIEKALKDVEWRKELNENPLQSMKLPVHPVLDIDTKVEWISYDFSSCKKKGCCK